MTPFAFLGLVLASGLGLAYFLSDDPSLRSKVAIGAVLAVSILISWRYPQWSVVSTVMQSAVGIYVLIYFRVNSYD